MYEYVFQNTCYFSDMIKILSCHGIDTSQKKPYLKMLKWLQFTTTYGGYNQFQKAIKWPKILRPLGRYACSNKFKALFLL